MIFGFTRLFSILLPTAGVCGTASRSQGASQPRKLNTEYSLRALPVPVWYEWPGGIGEIRTAPVALIRHKRYAQIRRNRQKSAKQNVGLIERCG